MPVTLILAVPLPWLVAGVKTAVRVSPVPLIAPRLPFDTTTSPAVPFHAKLLPGSSEKVKVMLAVEPASSVEIFDVISTVGAVVSTK